MSGLMRCAVLLEPKRIELHKVPIPEPGPGAILVRVRAALTDGTDLKAYRRGHPQMPMPTRFGHEFSGDVAAVGAAVTAFAAGDAVMTVHSAPCGECFWCKQGEEELCASIMETKILGAYAQYIEVPAHIVARNCFSKPPELSYAAAAFLEPLACVVHSLQYLAPRGESTVLVIGDGGFGLLHCLALLQAGVVPVLAGHNGVRLSLARALGVPHTIDRRSKNLHRTIGELSAGRGADAVIECTGREEVWEEAPELVRRGGVVSFFGGLPGDASVRFRAARMHYDEVRLISPFHFGTQAVRRARDLLAGGAIDPLPLVTKTLPLENVAEAFKLLDAGEGIKFELRP